MIPKRARDRQRPTRASKAEGVPTGAQEMKRCLFVFAKLNPGLRYVQGMNELLAPLYYHFRTDPAPNAAAHAEADAFYCFMDLLAEFRDHFCQQLARPSSPQGQTPPGKAQG